VTSIFQFPGGAANSIRQIITATTPTIITLGTGPQANQGQYNIAWFRCSEYAGGTPTLTVEIYDGTTSFYQGSGGFTWIAKALTAKQSVLFDDGYVVPNGSTLRITASVGSQVLVTGVYIGKQQPGQWAGPAGK
jgi:hypothetical protein